MSDRLDHPDAQEMIGLAALEALTAPERAAFDAHVATCIECTRDLTALRDAAASLGASLPARPMAPERGARMRARLLARAAADRGRVTSPPAWRPRLLAAAALIFAAGAIAYGAAEHGGAERLATELAQLRDTASAMQHSLAEQRSIVAALTGPGVRVIDVAAVSARAPFARMFWDQPANRWTFVAYNLPPAAPGRAYQLWLITRDQRKVSAGTFAPSATGAAFLRASYTLARDSLLAIAVTNEPAGGSPQPTTTPFLVGNAPGS
jgi:anti-sigma-K factor RskA